MSAKRLPKTDSIEELAQFWDTHDLTEFESELEEVPEPVFADDAQVVTIVVTIDFQSWEAKAIRQMANSKRLAEEELIRSWVLEKLHSS